MQKKTESGMHVSKMCKISLPVIYIHIEPYHLSWDATLRNDEGWERAAAATSPNMTPGPNKHGRTKRQTAGAAAMRTHLVCDDCPWSSIYPGHRALWVCTGPPFGAQRGMSTLGQSWPPYAGSRRGCHGKEACIQLWRASISGWSYGKCLPRRLTNDDLMSRHRRKQCMRVADSVPGLCVCTLPSCPYKSLYLSVSARWAPKHEDHDRSLALLRTKDEDTTGCARTGPARSWIH